MKIAFTICSNNYLAQAKILGDTLKMHNPDYKFFIGLVDKRSELIDYEKEIGHKIIESENIGIPNFEDLWKRYSIIELNTCVKPFFFEYFINKNLDLEFLYYLDPDTYVFESFDVIEEEFGSENNILLTPHIVTPIALDGKQPDEPIFLNYGIYNLGFLGLKNPLLSKDLLNWWKERTYNLGYNKVYEGLFVDQLWFNLVPLFFENVKYTYNLGMNMGPWNIHERNLSRENDSYKVNGKHMLIFYHFSNYKFSNPEQLASHYDRFSLEERTDLQPIYKTYLKELIGNNVQKLHVMSCFYMDKREEYLNRIEQQKIKENRKLKRTYGWWLKKIVVNIMPPILFEFLRIKNFK